MEQKGIQIINDLVGLWSSKFFHMTRFIRKEENVYRFVCVFSQPTPRKPIPITSVKVDFFIEETSADPKISYRFESDSLVHYVNQTIVENLMEKWIEKILDKKIKTHSIMYLGTEFEQTRISHPKIDQMHQENIPKPEVLQILKLDKQLLENPDELHNISTEGDYNNQFQSMKRILFDLFRAVDANDNGFLTIKEFQTILNNMNLDLTPLQMKEICNNADNQKLGIINYHEWINCGAELVFGMFLKAQVEQKTVIKEEEYFYEALMILFNDEIHVVAKELEKQCYEEDVDETNFITIVKLQFLLESREGLLVPSEVNGIIKAAKKEYGEKFPYKNIYDLITKFKLTQIKNGLMESSLSKLDQYLISVFRPFDSENTGFVKIQQIIQALRKSDKIVLSNFQLYMLQNFIDHDEGVVEYGVAARQIAEIIKRFFSPEINQKKAQLIQHGYVKPNELMEGWSEYEIKSDMQSRFKALTKASFGVSIQDYSKIIETCKLKITQKELQFLIDSAPKKADGKIDWKLFSTNFQFEILKILRTKEALQRLTEI